MTDPNLHHAQQLKGHFESALLAERQGQFGNALQEISAGLAICHQLELIPWALDRAVFYAVQLGKLEAAYIYLHKLMRHQPVAAIAYLNLGRVCYTMHKYAESAENLEQFLTITANADDKQIQEARNEAHLKCAIIYRDQLQRDASLHHLAQCPPGQASTIKHSMFTHLLFGNYDKGLEFYEQRNDENLQLFSQPTFAYLPHHNLEKYYKGEDLSDKTLLIACEQGYGDCIQWARFIPKIAVYCAQVIVEIYQPLHQLMAENFNDPKITWVIRGETPPAFDYWLLMGSLPFGLECTADQLPISENYIRLHNPPLLFPKQAGKTNIGLVWQNNPNARDHQLRSIDIHELRAIITLKNCAWFSLQRHNGDLLASGLDGIIQDLSPLLTSFWHTAAIIAHLDIVITIDSAIAHLAGAMGKKTFILLNYGADWRYGDGQTSPWYPNAHILLRRTQDDTQNNTWKNTLKAINFD